LIAIVIEQIAAGLNGATERDKGLGPARELKGRSNDRADFAP
jgi:hypothetical protein